MEDRNLNKSLERDNPGETICFCFYKNRQQIIDAIREHQLKTVEEVGKFVKAGTNCGNCKPRIELILKEFWKKEKGEM
jgi:assimilatory nitrate reductase catalytic subunit